MRRLPPALGWCRCAKSLNFAKFWMCQSLLKNPFGSFCFSCFFPSVSHISQSRMIHAPFCATCCFGAKRKKPSPPSADRRSVNFTRPSKPPFRDWNVFSISYSKSVQQQGKEQAKVTNIKHPASVNLFLTQTKSGDLNLSMCFWTTANISIYGNNVSLARVHAREWVNMHGILENTTVCLHFLLQISRVDH